MQKNVLATIVEDLLCPPLTISSPSSCVLWRSLHGVVKPALQTGPSQSSKQEEPSARGICSGLFGNLGFELDS